MTFEQSAQTIIVIVVLLATLIGGALLGRHVTKRDMQLQLVEKQIHLYIHFVK